MKKKIFVWLLSMIVFLILFFGIGSLNGQRYYDKTIEQAKEIISHYFEEKGESIVSISLFETSYAYLEITVYTSEGYHYVECVDNRY